VIYVNIYEAYTAFPIRAVRFRIDLGCFVGVFREIRFESKGRCSLTKMEEMQNLNTEKINFIKHIYEWNQQITHVADAKVSALQIINTLIISFSATVSIKDLTPYSKMGIIAAVVSAAFSSLMLLMTILPRLSKGASVGINFYSGILKYSWEEYCSRMAAISLDELLNDYLNSIYMIALIQEKKYFRLKLGLIFSFIAISLVGAAIVLNILLYHK
jgi:hypothetical protein